VYESEIDYPASIYDLNKLVAEKYLELYYRQYGIPGVALRLANVYGPGKQAGSADRGVINLMIRRALAGEPLTVYGDGDWVRDYVYIDDVVSAFLQSGAAMDRAAGNHYLVGSGTGTRFVDAMSLVAERAESVTGSKPQITHVPWPIDQLSIDERNFIANTSSMSEVTGWRSRVTLTEGIDRTIKYYQLAATGDAPVALDPHGHRRN
jgi:UDP-glucose 4-epimerase